MLFVNNQRFWNDVDLKLLVICIMMAKLIMIGLNDIMKLQSDLSNLNFMRMRVLFELKKVRIEEFFLNKEITFNKIRIVEGQGS